jgi:hypothetical protein
MGFRKRFAALSAPSITVVMLAAGMFAPSIANAECGNYIVYTNPKDRSGDAMPKDNHRMPVECHGPFCSLVPPSAPLPHAPPSVRILGDEPLPQTAGDSAAPRSASCLRPESANGEVIRRPADIYHPPR